MTEVIRLGGGQPISDDVIRLTAPKKPKKIFFPKIGFSPIDLTGTIIKTITSPKLTVGLAGALGTLLGGPITGIKTAALTGLGVGILESSPKAREFIGKKIVDPTRGGRFVGEQIEKIGQDPLPSDKGLKEKIIEGAKKAGIIGAAAAAGVGAATIGKQVIEKAKGIPKPTIPKIPTISKAPAQVIQLQQLPQQVPPQIAALAPAEKPMEEKKAVPVTTMPSINTKIKVAPEINISFRKSRRFINQQILVRS